MPLRPKQSGPRGGEFSIYWEAASAAPRATLREAGEAPTWAAESHRFALEPGPACRHEPARRRHPQRATPDRPPETRARFLTHPLAPSRRTTPLPRRIGGPTQRLDGSKTSRITGLNAASKAMQVIGQDTTTGLGESVIDRSPQATDRAMAF